MDTLDGILANCHREIAGTLREMERRGYDRTACRDLGISAGETIADLWKKARGQRDGLRWMRAQWPRVLQTYWPRSALRAFPLPVVTPEEAGETVRRLVVEVYAERVARWRRDPDEEPGGDLGDILADLGFACWGRTVTSPTASRKRVAGVVERGRLQRPLAEILAACCREAERVCRYSPTVRTEKDARAEVWASTAGLRAEAEARAMGGVWLRNRWSEVENAITREWWRRLEREQRELEAARTPRRPAFTFWSLEGRPQGEVPPPGFTDGGLAVGSRRGE